MTTEIEPLRAIAANIDEDTPRLIYADWLDEHATSDNTHAARAEFIRLNIRLTREGDQLSKEVREPLETREADLNSTNVCNWQEVLGDKSAVNYYRGFIASVAARDPDRLIASQIISDSASMIRPLRLEPVTDVHVATLADQLRHSACGDLHLLAGSHAPWYSEEAADPRQSTLTDAGVEHLTHLTSLRKLTLDCGGITAVGAALIANRMTSLESLHIDGSPIGAEGAARIATMSNLKSLGLSNCEITRAGAEVIARSPTLPLSAKVAGLESAGFQDLADQAARNPTPSAQPIEWLQTNWRGHPGEILYRAPVGGLAVAQVSELREQVIDVVVQAGLSRAAAAARVVVRHSAELGQDAITVVGNAASLALVKAVGRGRLPGVCQTNSGWRDSAGSRNHAPELPPR